MKRVSYFGMVITILSLIICCDKNVNNQYGQSGNNAIQYVKENSEVKSDVIESIEITQVDSLLSDDILDERAFKEKADIFYKTDNKEEFGKTVDEVATQVRDLYSSWRYGERNDSLRKLSKYQDAWRLVYTVTITTKSTAQHNIRVLMDKDGITPQMTEKEFKERMNKRSGLIEAMTTKLNWDW